MNSRAYIKYLPVALLLLFLVVPVSSALAASAWDFVVGEGEIVYEDVVVNGERVVVEKGGELNGDVFVSDGELVVKGTLDGDVAMWRSTAAISGTVEGDVISVDGQLRLAESGDIEGDCVTIGGDVVTASRSQTSCLRTPGIPGLDYLLPEGTPLPISTPSVGEQSPLSEELASPTSPSSDNWVVVSPHGDEAPFSFFNRLGLFVADVLGAVGWSVALMIAAFLIASVAPVNLGRVRDTLVDQPVASGLVGVLTGVAIPSLMAVVGFLTVLTLILCVGILGIPVLFLLALALGGGLLVGWVAIGSLVGDKLSAYFLLLEDASFAMRSAVGTGVITLVSGLASAVPIGCWNFTPLLTATVSCIGLGAVALTQFGRRPYPLPPLNNNKEKEPSFSPKVQSILDTLPDKDDTPS